MKKCEIVTTMWECFNFPFGAVKKPRHRWRKSLHRSVTALSATDRRRSSAGTEAHDIARNEAYL